MWTERAIKVAEALRVLGFKYIGKDINGDVWVFENEPTPAPDRDDIKWRCRGLQRMLCIIMDMHYDPTTDTYLDDRLWTDLSETPIPLEDIRNE